MLTVVTPATSRKLTTVQRARSLLGFADNATGKVDILIDQASEVIVRYCGREFAQATFRETFNVCATGLRLARSPLVSVGSITMNGVALPSEACAIVDGVVHRAGSYPLSGWGLTVIEYVAGYKLPGETSPTLPADVERAAILLVGAYLSGSSRDAAIKSESVDGVGSTSWWVQGANDVLPSPEAQQLLQPYRALGFA